jgi:hypothetical protein
MLKRKALLLLKRICSIYSAKSLSEEIQTVTQSKSALECSSLNEGVRT